MSNHNRDRRREIRDRIRGRQLRAAADGMGRLMGRAECLLCGGRSVATLVWEPSPEVARRLPVAPGKIRAFGYTLCEACLLLPDPSARIEDEIQARWRRDTADARTD